MSTEKRKYITSWAIFVSVLLIALICREMNDNRSLIEAAMLGTPQTVIYIGLTVFWGISVRRRIVQPQSRRLLRYVSVLILFWFLDRSVKYYVLPFFDGIETVRRYLWYLYYIPMIFFPALMVMTAVCLRKPESYRLPKKAVIVLLSAASVLFLCVLTNDLHQLVFDFPEGAAVFTDSEYRYGFLYYLCLGWNIGCLLVAFILTIHKCRLPNSRKSLWIPVIPIALWGIYGIMYIIGKVSFFDDITLADSFLMMATLELCIASGLIPSNTHYQALLRASEISTVITDKSLIPVYTSHGAVIHDKTMMRKAVKNASVTENGVRLSAYPISGGYVFWEEDLAELIALTEELAELREELKEEYRVRREAYQTSRRRQMLVEKNRLYNIMQSETRQKVETLLALAEKLSHTEREAEMEQLVVEAAVLCAYLKRRNNLLFIKESSDVISGVELTYCIKESLHSFARSGADAAVNSDLSRDLSFLAMTRLYDAFELALETALHTTRELFVTLREKTDGVALRMFFVCSADLSGLAELGFTVDQDDPDEWVLEYVVREGGGAA